VPPPHFFFPVRETLRHRPPFSLNKAKSIWTLEMRERTAFPQVGQVEVPSFPPWFFWFFCTIALTFLWLVYNCQAPSPPGIFLDRKPFQLPPFGVVGFWAGFLIGDNLRNGSASGPFSATNLPLSPSSPSDLSWSLHFLSERARVFFFGAYLPS